MTATNLTTIYPDGRPAAKLRMEAKDQGVILRHGDGPGGCDENCAREALIFKEEAVYHLFTNHIGLEAGGPAYTDAVWVHWTADLNHSELRGENTMRRFYK